MDKMTYRLVGQNDILCRTGLWPIDPNIFPDYLFEPAETTNIPILQDEASKVPAPIENQCSTQEPTETTTILLLQDVDQQGEKLAEIPATSVSAFEMEISAPNNPDLLSTSQTRNSAVESPYLLPDSPSTLKLQEKTVTRENFVPINVISPVPKGVFVTGQGKRKPRKKPTVLVLTSTPNMEETKIKSAPPPVSKKRVRKVTKALNFSSSSDENFNSLQTYTATVVGDEDCPCIYCNDLFSRSKPKEVWLQCLSCKKWAHASCADVPKKITSFICELCQ